MFICRLTRPTQVRTGSRGLSQLRNSTHQTSNTFFNSPFYLSCVLIFSIHTTHLFLSSILFPISIRPPPCYSWIPALCSSAPIPGDSVCSTGYGTSLGRGSFKFMPGQWNNVAQRIKLNTPGKADGELQVSMRVYFTIIFYFRRFVTSFKSKKDI